MSEAGRDLLTKLFRNGARVSEGLQLLEEVRSTHTMFTESSCRHRLQIQIPEQAPLPKPVHIGTFQVEGDLWHQWIVKSKCHNEQNVKRCGD